MDTGCRMLRKSGRYTKKVPIPSVNEAPGDDSPIPEISSESTPKIVQAEDTGVPENSNTSPEKALRTRSRSREPPVEDSLGNLFVIDMT